MNESQPYEHGGNIYAAADKHSVKLNTILDFSANINPLGPPEWLRSVISSELESIVHYPDPTASVLKKCIADQHGLPVENILAANGSTELLYHLARVLHCKRAVIPVPCYVDYIKVMELSGVPVKTVPLLEEHGFVIDFQYLNTLLVPGDLLIIGNPNNPTGKSFHSHDLARLAEKHLDVLFLVDEAFLDFIDTRESLAGSATNIITLHSLTKFYAVPGLRLGYGVFPSTICKALQKILPPWTVNSLAQKVGERAISDVSYQQKTRSICTQNRISFARMLDDFKMLKVFPAEANYFLIRLLGNHSVSSLKTRLADKGILIRDCGNYLNLDNSFFRIAIKNDTDNQRFIDILATILPVHKKRNILKKTPSLMFQGTSSNAGKSILTTALCRILLQDGVRVAPFKAQNMSLNSYVTHDGLEMGRAQVVQAQAARLDPDVLMNPILLKPNSDTGSQVIVRGKALKNMNVMEYVSFKKQAMGIVSDCYDELASHYNVIILEGAGSPGEVNLKRHDIVNMRMARHAESPVVLVGDIDRGGVYASFVGHMEVLNQWERQLVAGFLVNRFRGNADLLYDAHEYVKNYTGKDVLGVIPYLKNHGIPEEDSVSFKEGLFNRTKPEHEHIVIAVINLPHISNFTDLEPFIAEADVHLRIVSEVHDLQHPDVIIIPGSKNVMGDLAMLKSSGMAEAIRKLGESGTEIVGICGGYQMLGRSIKDPYGIESSTKSIDALSLIAIETTLDSTKTLLRKSGTHKKSGKNVTGYEIHHGQTLFANEALFTYDDGSVCGTAATQKNIWGSYLHGIFDSDSFRRWFIDTIRQRKGLAAYTGAISIYDLEPAFDRLADSVREAMDMDSIYQLLRL